MPKANLDLDRLLVEIIGKIKKNKAKIASEILTSIEGSASASIDLGVADVDAAASWNLFDVEFANSLGIKTI